MENGADAGGSKGVSKGSRLAALRHPLVVGALLTVITALIASVVVPALTRSWQDRPRELSLKRELVARVARAAATTVQGGKQIRRDRAGLGQLLLSAADRTRQAN